MARWGPTANELRTHADIHDGQEPIQLQPKAGYIDARPLTANSTKTLLQRTAGRYMPGHRESPIGLKEGAINTLQDNKKVQSYR